MISLGKRKGHGRTVPLLRQVPSIWGDALLRRRGVGVPDGAEVQDVPAAAARVCIVVEIRVVVGIQERT